ncbi:putative transcriptional regulator [Bacillus sp. TS-2]|nr:putative transcriptional regulator [Bacillus sp. TS-2]
MEFNEKLQQLRKEKGWTQEQLAEELYVSRTAVSKWENGKGYPNIDSLKNLSVLFSISIDDLLSGDELITLAENENRTNMTKFRIMIFGVLDLMTITFLFLPLYIRTDSDMVRVVSLFSSPDIHSITMVVYIILTLMMAIFGIIQIFSQRLNEKQHNMIKISSILLHAFTILIFVITLQPTATSLLFLFFIVKVIILIKDSTIK